MVTRLLATAAVLTGVLVLHACTIPSPVAITGPSPNTRYVLYIEDIASAAPLHAGQPGELVVTLSAEATANLLADRGSSLSLDRMSADFSAGQADGRFDPAGLFFGLYVRYGNWEPHPPERIGGAGSEVRLPVTFAAPGTHRLYFGSASERRFGGRREELGANPDSIDFPAEGAQIDYREFTVEVLP